MAQTMSNINLLNAVRSRMSVDYRDRVPEATQSNIDWTYLTNGGSVTVRTDFTKPGGTPEPATIQNLNYDELMMDGGTE